jgi:phage baseplate assembly protein W
MRPYYKIPLNATAIIHKQRHSLLEASDAIKEHIHLILRTHYQECRFDNDYGCFVWDKDYETIRSVSKWKKELHLSILEALERNENRLSSIRVDLDVDEPKVIDPKTKKPIKLRKRITIIISGTISRTNERFQHTEYIFFSPLSLS